MAVYWVAVVTLSLLQFESCFSNTERSIDYSTYPTDFFEHHVPQFLNNRPIIAIVAMEVHGQKMIVDAPWVEHKDYFGSSFVKLVEAAGGRAVGIKEDIDDEELSQLLRKVNGAILPGGDADIGDSGYARISKYIVQFSQAEARKNITFPVLGICRGFQMMLSVLTGKDSLVETDSLNLTIPLEFTNEAKESRLFGKASKGLIRALKKLPITFNAHALGHPGESFFNDTELQKQVRAISVNYDRNGTQFISTFEGRHAPLYGLQWHPEKSLFVYNPALAVDHTIHAIMAAQYIANFFMCEARKNPNRFSGRKDEEEYLIMHTYPTYVGNITETPYEQLYLFDFVKPYERKTGFANSKDDGEENKSSKKSSERATRTLSAQSPSDELASSKHVYVHEYNDNLEDDDDDARVEGQSYFRGNFKKHP